MSREYFPLYEIVLLLLLINRSHWSILNRWQEHCIAETSQAHVWKAFSQHMYSDWHVNAWSKFRKRNKIVAIVPYGFYDDWITSGQIVIKRRKSMGYSMMITLNSFLDIVLYRIVEVFFLFISLTCLFSIQTIRSTNSRSTMINIDFQCWRYIDRL
jgi:hypothetical protein